VTPEAKTDPAGTPRWRVFLVDDHRMFAQAMRLLLQGEDDIEMVGTASSAEEALVLVERICPDIVVMDIDLPGLDGIEATRQLRERCPTTRVAVITALRDGDLITRAVRAGARGFLLKTRAAEDLVGTIRSVAEGKMALPEEALLPLVQRMGGLKRESKRGAVLSTLTGREMEVLRELDGGSTTEEIADALGLARTTIQNHVNAILMKFGVSTRLQAVLLYREGSEQ
jgi:DNA-binding NarL/FixJ family response regulator